jgi:nucleoside-diphosphate-sugar epimerase
MKNILILGSKGQVGSALTEHLSNKYNVIEFDLENSNNQDLRNRHGLDEILKNIDFVYFLAFDVGGSTYLKKYQDTKEFIDNNMKLILYTFESLEKHRTPFIFASSQMANMSYSNYGLLKTIAEKYTQILGGLLIKFWNVYGIEKDEKKFHVITDFIKSAKKNNHISIKTSGEEERQFLHTDDCCKCLEILMKNYLDIPRDKNLHITSFEWTKIIEIAKIISSINGCSYEVGVDNDIQQNKKNEADKFILNYWQPKINIKEGIKLVYDNI